MKMISLIFFLALFFHTCYADSARDITLANESWIDLDVNGDNSTSITEWFCWTSHDYEDVYGEMSFYEFYDYDTDGDGMISYDEFYTMYISNLRNDFNTSSNNGVIMDMAEWRGYVGTPAELRALNYNATDQDVTDAFNAADDAGDGLDTDEFLLAMTYLRRVARIANEHPVCSSGSTGDFEYFEYLNYTDLASSFFAVLDANNDNIVQLREGYCYFNENTGDFWTPYVTGTLNAWDTNGDGDIPYDEFFGAYFKAHIYGAFSQLHVSAVDSQEHRISRAEFDMFFTSASLGIYNWNVTAQDREDLWLTGDGADGSVDGEMGIRGLILVNLAITNLERRTNAHRDCADVARTVLVEEAFYDLDLDGSGNVTLYELFCWLERDYSSPYGRRAVSHFFEYDTNADSAISYDEFFTTFAGSIRVDFENDAGSDGVMTRNEWDAHIGSTDDLQAQNIDVSESRLNSIFTESDVDSSGYLDGDEFMVSITKLRRLDRTENDHSICSLNGTVESSAFEASAFSEMDHNSDGYILFAEFSCRDASDARREFFDAVDTTFPTGFVDPLEYSSALIISMIDLFDTQDIDNSGTLSEREFSALPASSSWYRYMATSLIDTSRSTDLTDAFHAADANQDRVLNFREYSEGFSRALNRDSTTLAGCEPQNRRDAVRGTIKVRGFDGSDVLANRERYERIFRLAIALVAEIPDSFVNIASFDVCESGCNRRGRGRSLSSSGSVTVDYEITNIDSADAVSTRLNDVTDSSFVANLQTVASEHETSITLPSTLNAEVNDVAFVSGDDDSNDDDNTAMITVIAVACVVGIVLVLGLILFARKRYCARRLTNPPCGKASDVSASTSMEMGTMADDYGIVPPRSGTRSHADIAPSSLKAIHDL